MNCFLTGLVMLIFSVVFMYAGIEFPASAPDGVWFEQLMFWIAIVGSIMLVLPLVLPCRKAK